MKNLLITVFFLVSMNAYSWDAPEIIENACYQGCTPKMEKMYENFLNTKTAPVFIPGMYSGECHHNSWALDPETTHYIGLLLDQDSKGTYLGPSESKNQRNLFHGLYARFFNCILYCTSECEWFT